MRCEAMPCADWHERKDLQVPDVPGPCSASGARASASRTHGGSHAGGALNRARRPSPSVPRTPLGCVALFGNSVGVIYWWGNCWGGPVPAGHPQVRINRVLVHPRSACMITVSSSTCTGHSGGPAHCRLTHPAGRRPGGWGPAANLPGGNPRFRGFGPDGPLASSSSGGGFEVNSNAGTGESRRGKAGIGCLLRELPERLDPGGSATRKLPRRQPPAHCLAFALAALCGRQKNSLRLTRADSPGRGGHTTRAHVSGSSCRPPAAECPATGPILWGPCPGPVRPG